MRILRVRTIWKHGFYHLDKVVKELIVNVSHTVGQLMVQICQEFGLTNHEEYSLIWENCPKVKLIPFGGI